MPAATATSRRGFALPWLDWIIYQTYPRSLGALFLVTAVQKALNSSGVERVLEFDGVPQTLTQPMVSIIIVIEAFLGVVLLLRPALKPVLDATMLLLTVYTLQLACLTASSEAPGCACLAAWESYKSARLQNLLGIGRNVCLILPLVWVRMRVAATRKAGTSLALP